MSVNELQELLANPLLVRLASPSRASAKPVDSHQTCSCSYFCLLLPAFLILPRLQLLHSYPTAAPPHCCMPCGLLLTPPPPAADSCCCF